MFILTPSVPTIAVPDAQVAPLEALEGSSMTPPIKRRLSLSSVSPSTASRLSKAHKVHENFILYIRTYTDIVMGGFECGIFAFPSAMARLAPVQPGVWIGVELT